MFSPLDSLSIVFDRAAENPAADSTPFRMSVVLS